MLMMAEIIVHHSCLHSCGVAIAKHCVLKLSAVLSAFNADSDYDHNVVCCQIMWAVLRSAGGSHIMGTIFMAATKQRATVVCDERGNTRNGDGAIDR